MDPPRTVPAEDGPRRGRTPPRRAPARCDERARAAEDDDSRSKRAEGATIASSSACNKSYADGPAVITHLLFYNETLAYEVSCYTLDVFFQTSRRVEKLPERLPHHVTRSRARPP